MPDVNNSLAAQIQVPQIDIGGTLEKAARIQNLGTENELKQQELKHRQFLYDQGGGFDPSEQSTLGDVARKRREYMGSAAGAYLADPTPENWERQVKTGLRDRQINLEQAEQLRAIPHAQRDAIARSQLYGGQPAGQTIEQSGVPAGNRAFFEGKQTPFPVPPGSPVTNRSDAAGARGPAGGPSLVKPLSAAIDADDTDVRTGLVKPTPDQIRRGVKGPNDPGATTPNQTVADRFPKQSPFQPRIIRNPDGSISSSANPETEGLQRAAVDRVTQIRANSAAAQGAMSQLDQIEHENEVLNSSGWSSTGANAQQKLATAKSINSFFTTLGMPAPIDPSKVAAGESYNKLTFRAGADFARTLGGHAAESVVTGAVAATPNVENTYFGSKVITNSMRQAMQRQIDLSNYIPTYLKEHGTTDGVEDDFNKKFPPKLYSQTAIANAIDPRAITLLRSDTSKGDKEAAVEFDRRYGRGMSAFILQNGQPK
jgi:hypothetical protein